MSTIPEAVNAAMGLMTKRAVFVIYESPNGHGDWIPVLPENVPEWLKDADVMGQLAAGQMACDTAVGDKGSNWYRAEKVGEIQ